MGATQEPDNKTFLKDLNTVGEDDVVVWVPQTKTYLTVSKREILLRAKTSKIKYRFEDGIFKIRRIVIEIL